jgi:hypothetical protein
MRSNCLVFCLLAVVALPLLFKVSRLLPDNRSPHPSPLPAALDGNATTSWTARQWLHDEEMRLKPVELRRADTVHHDADE